MRSVVEYDETSRFNYLQYVDNECEKEHIGRNLYYYDLSPLGFLRLRRFIFGDIAKILGIDTLPTNTINDIECVIMEETLKAVLSGYRYQLYLNNIPLYLEWLSDYIYEKCSTIISYNMLDVMTIEVMKRYLETFSRVTHIILSGSINVNCNLEDKYQLDIDNYNWNDMFSVIDYNIIPHMNYYKLEICKYYYIKEEHDGKSLR